MSQRAREYVLTLSREQVTARQKHVLMEIAEAHRERYNTAHFSNASLGEDVLMGERQLRRVLAALDKKGLISYAPGKGAGNFSYCTFPALPQLQTSDLGTDEKEDTKGTERGHKEVIKGSSSDTLIRKRPKPKPYTDDDDLNIEQLPSSSSFSSPIDEVSVRHVLQEFEQSPITVGTATQADGQEARTLLRKYTAEQIVFGILLGSARKAQTISQQTEPYAANWRVQSLKYFREAIAEASHDPNCNEGYVQYLRHVLAKVRRGSPSLPRPPERALA